MRCASVRWLVGIAVLLSAATASGGWYDDYAAAQRLYRDAGERADLLTVIALCRQALEQGVPDRRVGEVQYLLGRAAYDSGQPRLAVKALRLAVTAEPAAAEYRLWLGYAYEADQRPTLAIRLFQDLRADPATDAEVRASAEKWLVSLHEPPSLAEREPRSRLEVAGAVIHHHPGEAAVAEVRDALGLAHRQLLDQLGVEVAEPVHVVLFRTAAEYQAYHRARQLARPEWSTACTINGRIFTYPAAAQADAARATLTHEYTHVALRAYAEDRALPCWLDEGLACLLSGQFPSYRADLRGAARLLSLEALLVPSFSAYGRDDARLAYVQSKAMVEDLLRAHGTLKLRACLRAIGQGQDALEAFEATFGRTMAAFYDWWFTERVDAG